LDLFGGRLDELVQQRKGQTTRDNESKQRKTQMMHEKIVGGGREYFAHGLGGETGEGETVTTGGGGNVGTERTVMMVMVMVMVVMVTVMAMMAIMEQAAGEAEGRRRRAKRRWKKET
jgi:hypothetical protein